VNGVAVFKDKAAFSTPPSAVDKESERVPRGAALPKAEPVLGAPGFRGEQIRDLFQNERGIAVRIDRARDAKLTAFGQATLRDRYLLPEESFQDLFARVAAHFADDSAHAQRLYDYISNLWFMPSTPILSNGGTTRGLPISCFLNESDDSLEGIVDLWNENVWLAARGGGIGSYWGNLRSIGEKVGLNGKTSGVVPFSSGSWIPLPWRSARVPYGAVRPLFISQSPIPRSRSSSNCADQPAATPTARRSTCTTAW